MKNFDLFIFAFMQNDNENSLIKVAIREILLNKGYDESKCGLLSLDGNVFELFPNTFNHYSHGIQDTGIPYKDIQDILIEIS
jgi:hypothetical protein